MISGEATPSATGVCSAAPPADTATDCTEGGCKRLEERVLMD